MRQAGLPQPARAVVAAFVAAIVAFAGSTFYAASIGSELHNAMRARLEETVPSLHEVAAARTELHNVERAAARLASAGEGEVVVHRAALADARASYVRAVEQCASRAVTMAEERLASEARRHAEQIRQVVMRDIEPAAGTDTSAARAALHRETAGLADAADATLAAMVEQYMGRTTDLARSIEEARDRSMRIALALDAAAGLVAIVAGILAVRVLFKHAALLAAHDRLLEDRAAELETFAGRVAHDVLSPLSAVTFALAYARRSLHEDPHMEEMIDRGARSVQRVRVIVDALLDFARSGARPSELDRADLCATLDGVAEEVRMSELGAGFTIDVDTPARCDVACGHGVLTSILSNLLNNAVKYSQDSAERRVTVRTALAGSVVRCEVTDTGPGIPPGSEDTLFLPYVRGAGVRPSGIGLGLATVKRLVEAHAGKVGVRSSPGEGSTFWFELPAARSEAPALASATAS
jgi:signal transduction histidine kinase